MVNKIPEINGSAKLEYGNGIIKIVFSSTVLANCLPRKNFVRVAVKLSRSTELDKFITDSGLDDMGYYTRTGRYRIRMHVGEDNNYAAITELISAGINDIEM